MITVCKRMVPSLSERERHLRLNKAQRTTPEEAFVKLAVGKNRLTVHESDTETKRTRMSVKHSVGAATLLIHMLAKHDTPINESSTTLGLVPAKLNTRVMSTRSMLVLLSADAIVNPPIKSMIVGENMTEKMYLKNHEHPE